MEHSVTLDNTIFVSAGAYSEPEEKCRCLIQSAEHFDVPITWLSWKEPWQGFYHHKLVLLLEKCKEWREEGIDYAFVLDASDVVFADPVDVILRKAVEIYEPGTLLFNAEFDFHVYPYKREAFKEVLKHVGCHLNGGLIFGSLDAFITVIGYTLDVFDGIRNGVPREGIAQVIHDDVSEWKCKPGKEYLMNNDQFAYQIASIYYPEHFRVDTRRYLFSWVSGLNRPIDEMRQGEVGLHGIGEASVIHSSNTVHQLGEAYWRDWVEENVIRKSGVGRDMFDQH